MLFSSPEMADVKPRPDRQKPMQLGTNENRVEAEPNDFSFAQVFFCFVFLSLFLSLSFVKGEGIEEKEKRRNNGEILRERPVMRRTW